MATGVRTTSGSSSTLVAVKLEPTVTVSSAAGASAVTTMVSSVTALVSWASARCWTPRPSSALVSTVTMPSRAKLTV